MFHFPLEEGEERRQRARRADKGLQGHTCMLQCVGRRDAGAFLPTQAGGLIHNINFIQWLTPLEEPSAATPLSRKMAATAGRTGSGWTDVAIRQVVICPS